MYKNYFLNIFKNIKNKLKTFQISKIDFYFTKHYKTIFKNCFLELFQKTFIKEENFSSLYGFLILVNFSSLLEY